MSYLSEPGLVSAGGCGTDAENTAGLRSEDNEQVGYAEARTGAEYQHRVKKVV